jgi:hypothetical protein
VADRALNGSPLGVALLFLPPRLRLDPTSFRTEVRRSVTASRVDWSMTFQTFGLPEIIVWLGTAF